MAERAKLFDQVPDPDLRRFVPREAGQGPSQPAPELNEVRQVSAAAGFPNRDVIPASPDPPERHYYRTGRDIQFNTKVTRETKEGYYAVAAEDSLPMGKILEQALAALMRERTR